MQIGYRASGILLLCHSNLALISSYDHDEALDILIRSPVSGIF